MNIEDIKNSLEDVFRGEVIKHGDEIASELSTILADAVNNYAEKWQKEHKEIPGMIRKMMLEAGTVKATRITLSACAYNIIDSAPDFHKTAFSLSEAIRKDIFNSLVHVHELPDSEKRAG